VKAVRPIAEQLLLAQNLPVARSCGGAAARPSRVLRPLVSEAGDVSPT
jgi:hypothetical protein